MERSFQNSFLALDNYSGPLDLLLDLIRKQKMDIFQIDIHKITVQYVEYLSRIPHPDLEEAGDFIRMASILLYIKSKSLLPEEEKEKEDLSASELKKTLVKNLIHYQKSQTLAGLLYNRKILGRDCWKSPRVLKKPALDKKITIDKEKGMFQIIQFYHKALLYKKGKKDYIIQPAMPTLLHSLKQILKALNVGAKLKFHELILINKEKHSRLLSFLSILELSKNGFISLFQKHLFSNIEILVKKPITEDYLNKIGVQEEKTSSKMFEKNT